MAPLPPRRLLVALTAVVVVALLAVGGALLLQGGDEPGRPTTGPSPTSPTGSPTPSPTAPPTAPGGVQRTRFGAAPEGANAAAGYAAALAQADSTLGTLDLVRLYDKGAPEPWPGRAPGRDVVVSFKLPPDQVLAGTDDAAMTQWFAGAPRDTDTYWVFQHEPEPDIAQGDFTAEQFRGAFAHLADLARRAGNPRLHATLVLQSYTLKPASNRHWEDYYPGAAAVDVFAWDVYNRPSAQRPYTSPEQLMDGPRGVSESTGKPFAVAELGSILAPGDTGSGRAAWLREVGAYVQAHHAAFVCWFDLDFANGPNGAADYRLRDPDSVQAWRQVAGT